MQWLIEGWRRGDRFAFDQMVARLWDHGYPPLYWFCVRRGVPRDATPEFAAWAFWAAVEELDLILTGGDFMTEVDTRGRREGKVSERDLSRREKVSERNQAKRAAFEWRGEAAFSSFFRGVGYLRCQDAIRRWRKLDRIIDAGADEAHLAEILDPVPGPELYALGKAELVQMEQDLYRLAEALAPAREGQRLVCATLLYHKVAVARCSLRWCQAPVDQVHMQRIREFVIDADLSGFSWDGAEWRRFLLDVLFDPPEEAPDGEKRGVAWAWLEAGPKPGNAPTTAQKARAAALEKAREYPAPPGACRPETFEGLVRAPAQMEREELVRLFAHFASCDACCRRLGEQVNVQRNRARLDQQIHRLRPKLAPIVPWLFYNPPRPAKEGGR